MADQPKTLRISRDQLRQFLPNQDTIRRFEELFTVASQLAPDDIKVIYELISDVTTSLGSASSTANVANDAIQRLAALIQREIYRPAESMPTGPQLDYIDFSRFASFFGQQGRIGWNATDDTLDVGHANGVVQQVGLELYARVTNATAGQFNNGIPVGIDPATGNYVPYIANGTLPSSGAVGLATENIPAAGTGRVSVWGLVRGIDTSGAGVGESWAVGDLLYVSPTASGALTKVRPNSPNLVIPMGRVMVVSPTAGQVFVRPMAEPQRYYGQFSKNADQTPVAANTAYAITWTTTGNAVGVSIGTPTSRIVTANPGLYRFTASVQLTSSSSTVKNVWIWFRKNGVDIANSALITSLDSGTSIRAPSRSMMIPMVAGDYVELMYASDSTNVTVDAVPATAFAPAAPAALLSATQEQQ